MSETYDADVTGYNPDDVLGFDADGLADASNADLADAVPDPLGRVDYTGSLEKDAAAELDAVSQGFRDRKAKEAERFELATNSDYWLCLCFATQAQRDAFLAGTGWRDLGLRFLDGREVARRQGVALPPNPEWPNAKRDASWDAFAMTIEENRSIDPERGGDTS
jgi:hypothetical protein